MLAKIVGLAALLGIFATLPATAAVGPAGAKEFKHECSACHMAFPPQMLPDRSWQAILGHLDQHFGEDASVDQTTRKQIGGFLHAYAADGRNGGRVGRYFMRTIGSKTPLRITETKAWRRIHDEVRRSAWSDPRVKTRSNCLACHRRNRSGDAGGGEAYENE